MYHFDNTRPKLEFSFHAIKSSYALKKWKRQSHAYKKSRLVKNDDLE